MENDLNSSPRRNCKSIDRRVRSASVIASRRTCDVYAFPLTETICISDVMPALNAGLFHQTLPTAFDGGTTGASPRKPPIEKPSDVEKSAPPIAVSVLVSQEGILSL